MTSLPPWAQKALQATRSLLIFSMLCQPLFALQEVQGAPNAGPQTQITGPMLDPGLTSVSSISGFVETPDNARSVESSSVIASNPTRQDYISAYAQAKALMDVGVEFRSRQLQRLDPATCVSDASNPDKCSFSVTGIQNNYRDFSEGRLYWRFCADYDEAYVGTGFTPQAEDDPTDALSINDFGYCPTWAELEPAQQTRRVASGSLTDDNGGAGASTISNATDQIDIRNQMIDAMRIFAFIAVAEPANLILDESTDEIKVNADGTIEGGSDGQPDRARDLAIYRMLQTAREIANVHMIYGNEFMVSALRFPFSTDGNDTQVLVENEQKKLISALRQFALASEVLLYALNYEMGDADDTHIADHFTSREFQLFAAATEKTVSALTELAKRDRILPTDTLAGDEAAIARLNESLLDQYLYGTALASQAVTIGNDDPATEVDERKLHFLNNGGNEIINNLRRIMQQSESIRAGLNPFGYDDAFVPLKAFSELLELTCGGTNSCGSGGLLATANSAGIELKDSQRTFDEKYDNLKGELTVLDQNYDSQLTEICGRDTADSDGDGLDDFNICGPRDTDGDGRYEFVPDAGLMAQNWWDIIAATNEVSLAVRRMEIVLERIASEEQRANAVITIIIEQGEAVKATTLANGLLESVRPISIKSTSFDNIVHSDATVSIEIGQKSTLKASANPVSCVLDGCDASIETTVENKFTESIGAGWERSQLSATETTTDENAYKIAQNDALLAEKEAIANADIEGANSADVIRNYLLDMVELSFEVIIAQDNLEALIAEHNLLRDQYELLLSQRNDDTDALLDSYLAKPYFRLFRDSAALASASTLDRASQAAYLTAKAYEYETLNPVSYMHELYRVRNAQNLRTFLDKLSGDYFALPQEQYSKRTYRLSLAEDIFGLTDQNLNPDGTLSQDEVNALRQQEFQDLLNGARITTPSIGFDKVIFVFSTDINHPKFLNGVFNNRIARVGTDDPGCASGCRGVWLNVETDQDTADFQGDLPQIKLTHGGHATYRNGTLDDVRYNPGPAVMIGRSLPPGFGGDTRAAIMTTHLNLANDAQPDQNKQENRFYNLSIATSQWQLEIDLTNPLENTKVNLSEIRDIEIRMDTTYVTPNGNQQVVAASNRALDANEAGVSVSQEDRSILDAYQVEQAAQVQAARLERSSKTPVEILGFDANNAVGGQELFGTFIISQPVVMGVIDIGMTLDYDPAGGPVTGTLCGGCSPLFDSAVALSGNYDNTTKMISFQTDSFTRTIGTRVANRVIEFMGTVDEEGNIEGAAIETITGHTANPVVVEASLSLSPLVNNVAPAAVPVNEPPETVPDNFDVVQNGDSIVLDVSANDSDSNGDPLTIVEVSTPKNGTATIDGGNIIYTPNSGFSGTDTFTYVMSDGKGGRTTGVVTVTVAKADDSDSSQVYLPMIH